jgi:hypothetical protein
MSEAFTTITTGTDLQDKVLINEIINAYSERRQALSQSAVSDIMAGADIQAASFWNVIQDWIEDNAASFVDDEAAIVGEAAVPMLTWAEVKTRTGLTSGWRRVTGAAWPSNWTDYEDAAFTYGQMAAGDIYGPWILEDLAAALSALKWTKHTTTSLSTVTSERQDKFIQTSTDDDPPGSLAVHETTWQAAAWAATGITPRTVFIAQAFYDEDDVSSSWSSLASKTPSKISTIPTFIDSICDVYVLPIGFGFPYEFYDYYGGFVENQLFLWYSEDAANDEPTRYTAKQPDDSYSAPCYIHTPTDSQYLGCRASTTVTWIAKWSFTYAN